MEIRQLNDGSIELMGYVNITERNSKVLSEKGMKFKEQIMAGAWKRAIDRNEDIKVLLNHSWDKVFGSTKDNLRLYEDGIGCRFNFRTDNEELIKYAKNDEFQGFSFAFRSNDEIMEDSNMEGIKQRYVKDMDVSEVSLLTCEPAYYTKVEYRDEDSITTEYRSFDTEITKTGFEEAETKTDEMIVSEVEAETDLRKRKLLIELDLI